MMSLGLLCIVACEGQHFAGNFTGERSVVFDLNAELDGDLEFKGLHTSGGINVTAITDHHSTLTVNITVLSFGDSSNGSRELGLEEDEPYCEFTVTSTCKTLLWGSQKNTRTCRGPGATEGCNGWYHTTAAHTRVYAGTSGLMTGWCVSSWTKTWRKLSTTMIYGRAHNTVSRESNQFSGFNIQWAVTCM